MSKKRYLIAMIMLVCLVDGIFFSMRYMQNTDEFTSIAVPAFYANLDWRDLTAGANFHGYGMTILLAPIFNFVSNGVILYKLCLVECLILRIICVVLSFIILNKYFNIIEKYAFLICLICNFSTLSPDDGSALSAMSEVPMALVLVVLSFLSIKYFECEKEKTKYVLLMLIALTLAYSTTIHSRSIIIIFSFFCTFFLYLILEKRFSKLDLKRILYFLLFFAIVFVTVYYVDGLIHDVIYQTESVTNTTATVASTKITGNIKKLADFSLVRTALKTLLSLLGSFTLYSFGMIWIVLSLNTCYVINEFREKWRDRAYKLEPLWYLAVFGIIGWCAMNAAIAMSSTGAVRAQNYRWLTYIRYAKPFTWGLMLSGFAILFLEKYRKKPMWVLAIIGIVCSSVFFMVKTVTLLDESGYGMGYTIFNRIFYTMGTARSYFSIYFAVFTICCGIIMILMVKKKWTQGMLFYLAVSMVIFGAQFMSFYGKNLGLGELTDEIVCLLDNRTEDTAWKIYYTGTSGVFNMYLRIALPDEDIYFVEDETDLNLDEGILLTDYIEEDSEWYRYCVVKLDENEYLVTANEEILDDICKMYAGNNGTVAEHYDIKNQIYNIEGEYCKEDSIMISGGIEESCWTSNAWSVNAGEYVFSYEMDDISFGEDGVFGNFEILSSRGLVGQYTARKEDVQKDGSAKIDIAVQFEEPEWVCFRLYTTPESAATLREVSYTQTSLVKPFGTVGEGVSNLNEIIYKIREDLPLYVISGKDEYCYLTDYTKVENAFEEREVLGTRYEDAVKGISGFVLMRNDERLLFDLLDEYIVIGKNTDYVLLASDDLQTELEKGGVECLSGEHGLYLEYYETEDGIISLPFGKYEVTVEDFDGDMDTAIFMSNSIEYVSDIIPREELRSQRDNIRKYELFSYGKTSNCYVKSTQGKVSIRCMEEELDIPLETFWVDEESFLIQDAILTGINGGIKIYGPFCKWPAGDYTAVCTYEIVSEMENGTEGMLGASDIVYNNMVIRYMELSADMVEDGQIVIEVPFVAQPTLGDPRLEVRTVVEPGIQLKLKSVKIVQ